jgi:hypothetical protein
MELDFQNADSSEEDEAIPAASSVVVKAEKTAPAKKPVVVSVPAPAPPPRTIPKKPDAMRRAGPYG